MLNDLRNIRLDKILRSIRAGKELNKEKLPHEEKVWYERFKNDLEKFLGKKSLPPEIKEIEEKNESLLLIRFLRQLPAIVGSDMKIYGPFQVEDIATLPKENAKALILKKAAKLVHF
jgi:DNA replication initiation complex subunit (GINS family)